MRKYHVDLILKKLRRKIWSERIVDWIINGLVASGLLITIFMIFVHMYLIIYGFKKAAFVFGLIMIITLIIGVLQRPKLMDAALLGDALGLQDRLITYLEYKEENTSFIEVFLEELEYKLKDCDFVKKYKLTIKGKKLFLGILLICISFGIYYLPIESREIVKEREEVNKILKEEAGEVKKVIEEEIALNKDKDMSKEVKDALQSLEKNLKDSYDFNEGAAEVAQAQREIEDKFRKDNEDMVEALSGIFQGAWPSNSDFKNALESKDIQNAIDICRDRSFTDKEQEKILEGLKLEEKRIHTAATKESLNEIKMKLQNKSFTGKKLAETLKTVKEKQAIQGVEKSVLDKLQETKERLFAKSDNGIKSNEGQEKLSTFTEGKETELSFGEEDNKEGNELLTGGFGNKFLNSSEGVGGGGRTASGEKTELEPSFGELEKNSEANRLKKAGGRISQIQGQESESGDITNKFSNEVLAVEGKTKNLETEWMEYKKEGMKYVYKQDIPLGRRELVMRYFIELSGGKENGGKNN